MSGYTRQSSSEIATSQVVLAAPLNAEFNQLQAAFHATTGHTHDGTAGNSPKISLTSSVSGILPKANGGTGQVSVDNTLVRFDGTSGLVQGTGIVVSDADVVTALTVTTLTSAGTTIFGSGSSIGLAPNTSDGSDSKFSFLSGGGAFSTTRGALIAAHGNEDATHPGKIRLIAPSNSNIEVTVGGTGWFNVNDYPVALVSTSTTAGTETDFPLGTTIVVHTGVGGAVVISINDLIVPRLGTGLEGGIFDLTGVGAALEGIWRTRGYIGEGAYLAQRVTS